MSLFTLVLWPFCRIESRDWTLYCRSKGVLHFELDVFHFWSVEMYAITFQYKHGRAEALINPSNLTNLAAGWGYVVEGVGH